MSETTIDQHRTKWSDLPLIPAVPGAVADDDDVAAWNDLCYMRALTDAIEDQADRDSSAIPDVGIADRAELLDALNAIRDDVPPFCDDRAAQLLAAWRNDDASFPATGNDDTAPATAASTPVRRRRFTIRRLVGAAAALAVLGGIGTIWATEAKADPGMGCETIRWGFLGSQRRTICDTPRRADGTWMRARVVWTPAGYVRGYCSFGTYYSSCSQGYYRDETVQAKETYPVNDGNVLQDEPGWLPTGTDVIR